MAVGGGALNKSDRFEPPSEMAPEEDVPPKDKPRRSSSTAVCLPELEEVVSSSRDPFWAVCAVADGCSCAGSGSKSINESSFAAFLLTPVEVPSVPFGILFAAVTLPAFISLYRSMVLWMLSLISNNLLTASASSDSSSHIFWIFGWALCRAFASSWNNEHI